MPVPDYGDPRPVKVQIAEDLRKQIEAGQFQVGEKLPPIRELAGSYHVVPGTIRDALDILRQDKVVQTRSTRGTYVLEPEAVKKPHDSEALAQQVEELRSKVHDLAAEIEDMKAVDVREALTRIEEEVTGLKGQVASVRNDIDAEFGWGRPGGSGQQHGDGTANGNRNLA